MADNSRRDELRAAAPELAKFVDSLRAEFGEVRVTYLRLPDGREFGKSTRDRAVLPADTTPVKQLQDKWQKQASAAARSRGSRQHRT